MSIGGGAFLRRRSRQYSIRAGSSGDGFAAYRRHHLAREHERLNPTPDQHNYDLTA
ncbi:hypothetical protein OHT57_04665 [Streptomyces sp. NBC_00285]|uniref:hypothetical protein n=1 Tax=Streptomyces sp. NBC_00285 TaxID=2975700 RepID=UPI002E2C3476|nr:hypothetical protein [Streptomyces sp. NBC_00285]